jgi:hypothetical protein
MHIQIYIVYSSYSTHVVFAYVLYIDGSNHKRAPFTIKYIFMPVYSNSTRSEFWDSGVLPTGAIRAARIETSTCEWNEATKARCKNSKQNISKPSRFIY